ncbi:hypothetical protein F4778DRAFT_388989 [Xylariomycetidae sp. FL2044]|nr:hypothetical protein F4778DRAFT_388989 [Xylariomycetidae sp. FL2044]
MMHSVTLALLGLPMAIATPASPLITKRAPTGQFSLYAYGSGIGGASIFSTGDMAYIGNPDSLGNDNAAVAIFTASADGSLIASPNTTASGTTPSWSNGTFYIPGTTSASHRIGFTNSTATEDMDTTGFMFYGKVALHKSTSGDLETLWYAVPTDADDVWALNWNTTGDEESGDKILVTLKTTAPSVPLLRD